MSGKTVDRAAVEQYLQQVDIPNAIAGTKQEAQAMGGLRGQYLSGLAVCLETMWNLAMEMLGKGPAVPYERCVEASTARAPEASQPEAKRERVALVELPVEERGAILREFPVQVPHGTRFFESILGLPKDPEAYAAAAPKCPVFRIDTLTPMDD
ncbi:hypothetical protein B4Q13_17320, partial [Lacticaseibacillus rhamnosus]